MQRSIKTIVGLMLIITPLFCQQGEWVQCSGEALLQNITNEEAQVIALRRARLDAIEQVCGVNLQAETLVHNFVMAGDFIHSVSYGNVVEEKDHSWKYETIPAKNPAGPPVIALRLTMNARVVTVAEKPDPYFTVTAALNRAVYQSGDEVIVNIQSTKDCYITVLCLAANDSVYILFPNRFREDNFIQVNTTVEIPSAPDRNAGLHFRVVNLVGHKKDAEMIKVIATRGNLSLSKDMRSGSGFGLLGTPKMAVTSLAQWLSAIPVSERAEATAGYSVVGE